MNDFKRKLICFFYKLIVILCWSCLQIFERNNKGRNLTLVRLLSLTTIKAGAWSNMSFHSRWANLRFTGINRRSVQKLPISQLEQRTKAYFYLCLRKTSCYELQMKKVTACCCFWFLFFACPHETASLIYS